MRMTNVLVEMGRAKEERLMRREIDEERERRGKEKRERRQREKTGGKARPPDAYSAQKTIGKNQNP